MLWLDPWYGTRRKAWGWRRRDRVGGATTRELTRSKTWSGRWPSLPSTPNIMPSCCRAECQVSRGMMWSFCLLRQYSVYSATMKDSGMNAKWFWFTECGRTLQADDHVAHCNAIERRGWAMLQYKELHEDSSADRTYDKSSRSTDVGVLSQDSGRRLPIWESSQNY